MKNKNKIPIPADLLNTKIGPYINKCINFLFVGEKLSFCLSHALFSCFDIDEGSRLLLKTIAQKINFNNIKDIRDVGAGIGVIGISIKKKYPHVKVTFTDRDALALDFTRENCRLNGIQDFKVKNELGIEDYTVKYDLIASNIPAKMGEPVHADLVKKILLSLTDSGLGTVVIIKALDNMIRQAITGNSGKIIFEEGNNSYTVFHFSIDSHKIDEIDINPDLFSVYKREEKEYKYNSNSYRLKTVYNIPDFDTLGYRSMLALEIIKNETIEGSCMFWNPMQGHIPVILSKTFPDLKEYILGSRDLLQLKTAEKNLLFNEINPEKIKIYNIPYISGLDYKVQNIFILPDQIPMADRQSEMLVDLYNILKPDGKCVISDKSSNIYKITGKTKNNNFRIKNKIKRYGLSSILLSR